VNRSGKPLARHGIGGKPIP